MSGAKAIEIHWHVALLVFDPVLRFKGLTGIIQGLLLAFKFVVEIVIGTVVLRKGL